MKTYRKILRLLLRATDGHDCLLMVKDHKRAHWVFKQVEAMTAHLGDRVTTQRLNGLSVLFQDSGSLSVRATGDMINGDQLLGNVEVEYD
jgi:hypothetical protein